MTLHKSGEQVKGLQNKIHVTCDEPMKNRCDDATQRIEVIQIEPAQTLAEEPRSRVPDAIKAK